MSGMRVTNRRYVPRMARGGQPVPNYRSDCSPALATGSVMRTGLAGNQQDNFQFLRNRLFESTVEAGICARKAAIMEVDADVGHDATPVDTAVPVAVEGCGRNNCVPFVSSIVKTP